MRIISFSDGNFLSFQVGDMEVTVLSDGVLRVPLANFPAATPEAAAGFLSDPDRVPIQVNAFLIRGADGFVLIDAGCGNAATPTGSRMLANLKASGVDPAAVRTVVLSHLHVDHAGGLIDEGVAVFPNANILVPTLELAYWLQPGFPEMAPERQKNSARVVQEVARAYSSRISTFVPGDRVAGHLVSIPLPGHTPGHCGFVINGGASSFFIWGDIVHSAALQFARSDWFYAADVDREEAMRSRRAMFEVCAADGRLVGGMHLTFPGVGTVIRDDAGYRFEPAGIAAGR